MLNDKAISELLDYKSPSPILSVYLNTSKTPEAYKLTLRSMLKGIDMPADEEAITRYIKHEFPRTGRSLALFSCAAEDYFRAYPLAVPVHSRVHIGNNPYVRPLANILDAYGAYGVALVDQQGARLFYFHMGQLIEQEGVLGEEVHKVRGVESSRNMVKRNLKESAEFAIRFFDEQKVRRILIGGTDKNVAKFQNNLPKTWRSLIVGALSLGMTANQQEILDEAIKVGASAEAKREAGLVRQMITAVAKHGEGVLGLRDTLRAADEGRVQTLLVDENYHASGYQCASCEYLTAEKLEICPFCGGNFIEIPDAVEMAIRRVMLSGGVVEIVRDNPEMAKAEIGGLLRYSA